MFLKFKHLLKKELLTKYVIFMTYFSSKTRILKIKLNIFIHYP